MITTHKTNRGGAIAARLTVTALALLTMAAATLAAVPPADAAPKRASGIVFVSDRDSPPGQVIDDPQHPRTRQFLRQVHDR